MTNTPSDSGQKKKKNWKDKSVRNQAQRIENAFSNQGENAPPRPPSMFRSQVQLASTYAPGTLFTWEGAKGICRSVPIDRELLKIEDATRLLIYKGINEITSNWHSRGSQVRLPDETPIQLILDDPFYNQRTQRIELDPAQFQLNEPSVMGYVPYPLLFRCATCGRLKEYQSIEEQANHPLPRRCENHEPRWTQVDVVYVHWSGSLEPLSPHRNYYDNNRQRVARFTLCGCGSEDFSLDNDSPVFSEWKFICKGCGKTRDFQQHDNHTLDVLTNVQRSGGRNWEYLEVNMLPISYRANSAFYTQKGTFIEFRDRSVVDLLMPDEDRKEQLLLRVANIHGFDFNTPSDDKIMSALNSIGRGVEWQDYTDHLEWAERAKQRNQVNRVEELLKGAADLKEKWFQDGVIERGEVNSLSLRRGVETRNTWARRYDPIRLTIEHDRFKTEHVSEKFERHEAVDVLNPDRLICDAVGNTTALGLYKNATGSLMSAIGIEELVLIRGLPICEFSFGFTRVSSTPVYNREHNGRQVPMPVRLNAFASLPNGKHPIYVTRQKNEALYFKLDEARVKRWLLTNEVDGLPSPDEEKSIGAAFLENYTDFEPFLDGFKNREGRSGLTRSLCPYTYMLLHSLSHQVMHSLADASGIDRDGLGEHIFPADLAFCVYRKGMTPDLGNISAMWRNHSGDFLRRILSTRQLRCGSGSLCDSRGGACPACIMVSEVTCIAGNHLLSRSCLRGGSAPNWEPRDSNSLVGYFDPRLAHD